jgi:hypothetical protein
LISTSNDGSNTVAALWGVHTAPGHGFPVGLPLYENMGTTPSSTNTRIVALASDADTLIIAPLGNPILPTRTIYVVDTDTESIKEATLFMSEPVTP